MARPGPIPTPAILRGLAILAGGVYQAHEASGVKGEFTVEGHRNVRNAREWLAVQIKAAGMAQQTRRVASRSSHAQA
jgi:hypothetical protein